VNRAGPVTGPEDKGAGNAAGADIDLLFLVVVDTGEEVETRPSP